MSKIAAFVIRPPVQSDTGKNPAKSNAAGKSTTSDFSQLLPAKMPPRPAAQAATRPSMTVAASASTAAETILSDGTFVKQQGSTATSGKTAKPGRKEPAARTQTSKNAAASSIGLASIIPPMATQPPETETNPGQNIAAPIISAPIQPPHASLAQTLEQPEQALPSTKPVSDPAAQTSPAGLATQTAIAAQHEVATANPSVSHGATAHATAIPAQLAHALPQATVKTGQNPAIHILLKPETLGTITVKLQHSDTGNTNVTITASQPETLETLKKDVTNLNQLLSNAGVPEAGRQIDFRAAPLAPAQSSNGFGSAGNSGTPNHSNGQHAPQTGTGFAHSSTPAAMPASLPVPAATPATRIAGSVDVIA